MNNKRLIEISLPLAEISAQSAREKSIRHGHISTLHIWAVRSDLCSSRYVLESTGVGAVVP
jgi:putative DNA methylase